MKYPKTWVCDNEDHINEMIEYWKPWLGLSDWAIKLSVKPMIDVHNQSLGATNWLLSRRIAWVGMSHSETRSSDVMADDAEQSLLHELLHIAFAAWHDHSEKDMADRGVAYDMCCEQPIDQLAETLVLMRRSSGHKFSFEQEASE